MTAYDPIPRAQQPPWLAQLFQVITVYAPDPQTGCGAALCRSCDLTWPLPLAELEADPMARAAWVLGVSMHGLEHAAAGEVMLDAAGEPLEDAQEVPF